MKQIQLLATSLAVLVLACGWLNGCSTGDATDSAKPVPTPAQQLAGQIMTADELRPGMKGYGLTVFAGARPERFEVEILSVLRDYDPKADMILIRCSGHDLETTGIAAGMSGSPIYVNDRLIGALAYGWEFTNQPIAGVQPIAQMMQNSGMHEEIKPAEQDIPGPKVTGLPVRGELTVADLAPGRGSLPTDPAGGSPLQTLASNVRPGGLLGGDLPRDAGSLRRLATPLVVSGGSPMVLNLLRKRLGDAGFVPLQSGGSGEKDPRIADARIEAGGTLTIPLLWGDMDLSALGTVTAVVGDRVLAFGHPMYAEGPVNLPMATGIVHTFIPSLASSFKMGSAGRIVGSVRRDESYSILGVTGQVSVSTPMTVRVKHWTGEARTYRYQVVDDWYFTSVMAEVAAFYSTTADHGTPIEMTVRYSGKIKFKGYDEYTFQGVGDGMPGVFNMIMRTSAPLDVMLNNRWGKALCESIELDVQITNELRGGYLEKARLETELLAPGEPAVVHARLMRYRKEPLEKKITIALPDNLPDGVYTLSLLDARAYTSLLQDHNPRKFTPRNMGELLDAYRTLAQPVGDRFYAVLTLPAGGVDTREQHLPELPGSRALMMQQSGQFEMYPFVEDRVTEMEMDMPVVGSRQWQIRIDRDKGKRL